MKPTHRLMHLDAKVVFPYFICVTPTAIFEPMKSGSWVKNNNFKDWMDYYTKIEDADSDCEDACFDAIEMRNACNERVSK